MYHIEGLDPRPRPRYADAYRATRDLLAQSAIRGMDYTADEEYDCVFVAWFRDLTTVASCRVAFDGSYGVVDEDMDVYWFERPADAAAVVARRARRLP